MPASPCCPSPATGLTGFCLIPCVIMSHSRRTTENPSLAHRQSWASSARSWELASFPHAATWWPELRTAGSVPAGPGGGDGLWGPPPREVPAARWAVKGHLHPTVPRLHMGKLRGADALFLHGILTARSIGTGGRCVCRWGQGVAGPLWQPSL